MKILLSLSLFLSASAYSSPLHEAVENSNRREAKRLIVSGEVDVNARNSEGETALHLVMYGLYELSDDWVEVMQLLLKHGADPNIKDNDGRTPYGVVRENPYPEACAVAAVFLKETVGINGTGEDGFTPVDLAMCVAMYIGDIDLLEYLMGAGADIRKANYHNHLDIALAVLRDEDLFLSLAAEDGGIEAVLDKYGSYHLVLAARYGHKEAVKILLSHGADPNVCHEKPEREFTYTYGDDIAGKTALTVISETYERDVRVHTRKRIMKILIDHGAGVRCRD